MESPGSDPEIHDWELLHHASGSDISPEFPEPHRDGQPPQGSDDGVIRCDYFSLDSHHKYHDAPLSAADSAVTVTRTPADDDVSVESDNISWIDPAGSETHYARISAGFWSDSSSDLSSDSIHRKLPDGESLQPGFADNIDMPYWKSTDGFSEVEEADHHDTRSSSKYWSHSGHHHPFGSHPPLDFSGSLVDHRTHVEADAKVLTDSAGIQPSSGHPPDRDEIFVPSEDSALELRGENGDSSSKPTIEQGVTCSREKHGDKSRVVWWKVPLEFLRSCVLGASPVWSYSVAAAAIMGFVLLGRRLYKMKRKTQGIHLKFTIDDKKVSHFMNRAARLNEAFSVVKRVPVVRPSLPAPGVGLAPWPVMSLR